MLVGRAGERAWLKRRVAQARRGKGCAVLVTGEPGVGKTALVGEVCAKARGATVLRAAGVESEASLGFSVLADLCRPLLGLLERIPQPQAAALQSALALGPSVLADRFAAYAGALSLVAAAAEREPLVVCVDDAHWLDAESAGAVAFCARRIYAEPILLAVAAREEEPLPLPSDVFETLSLGGLDAGASGELLARVSGGSVEASVAGRLYTATSGNPLALIELTALLSDAQLTGRAALEEPLQVGAGIERLFWRQVARQPESVRKALLLAAASNTGSVQEVAGALAAVGLSTGDLERAERSGLVTIADGRIEFKHPLVHAVVYRAAAPWERRRAHRALAETVTGPDAPLRRAWHRASATAGEDERVAQELEQAGTQTAMRTRFAAAASALERAAALSEDEEQRARRLLSAGNAAYLAGMLERAREASRTATEHAHDPRLQADCARLRANVEFYAGNVLDAHRMLLEAAERVAPCDSEREARLLIEATLPLMFAGESRSARRIAERAHQRARKIGGETELLARKWLGTTMIAHGEPEPGYRLVLEGLEYEVQHAASFESQAIGAWGVLCAVWVEEYERARAVSAALLSSRRTASAVNLLPGTLSVLSELEFRTGDWGAALAAASEAVSLAIETGQGGPAAYGLVSLARVEAAMGREHAAHEHAERALMLAKQSHVTSMVLFARAALGLLELGLSRPERAREELAPLPELTLEQGIGEPGVVCWQPDWIEANIRAGDVEQAEQALARLEREAADVKRTWALAAASRYRGLIAPDDQYERHFAQAMALHERTPTPFERARTELCFGERLRRASERRRAREQLNVALDVFRRLGAEPWAARAESELSGTGATRMRAADARPGRPTHELLTSQELQVAITVADGKTNKQAAAALFLSPKTIEFHLGHIYRKLDIHTRTQLAHKMLGGTRTQPPAPTPQDRDKTQTETRA